MTRVGDFPHPACIRVILRMTVRLAEIHSKGDNLLCFPDASSLLPLFHCFQQTLQLQRTKELPFAWQFTANFLWGWTCRSVAEVLDLIPNTTTK